MLLSTIASVATLVLFIFYFIGRGITIFAVKKLWKDKVIMRENINESFGVVDEVPGDRGFDEEPYGFLVSKEGIRFLKVYSMEIIEREPYEIRKDLIFQHEFLNINEAIAIYTMPGEIFATLIFEYYTFDYMKVEFGWRDNLKNGGFSELVQPKHTVKSFLYYMLR